MLDGSAAFFYVTSSVLGITFSFYTWFFFFFSTVNLFSNSLSVGRSVFTYLLNVLFIYFPFLKPVYTILQTITLQYKKWNNRETRRYAMQCGAPSCITMMIRNISQTRNSCTTPPLNCFSSPKYYTLCP